jgi:hypothetical protein
MLPPIALLPVGIPALANLHYIDWIRIILTGNRYGIYAAVLLNKADSAGAFKSPDQRRGVTTAAQDFASSLGKAASTESHICHRYSRMLKQLWSGRTSKGSRPNENSGNTTGRPRDHLHEDINQTQAPAPLATDPTIPSDEFVASDFFNTSPLEDGSAMFPSIEGYLLGSFMPGVADFTPLAFDDPFVWPDSIPENAAY